MNARHPACLWPANFRRALATCTLLLGVNMTLVIAQPVFTIGPEPPVRPPPLGAARAIDPAAQPGRIQTTTSPSNAAPIQAGPFSVRPHFSYAHLYGDGIHVEPGEELATAVDSFGAGFQLGMGSNWTIDYTGMRLLYSNPRFRDAFDHAASLNGAKTYHDWTFRLFYSYVTSSLPLVETGQQTPQEEHTAVAMVAYSFGSRLLADFSFNENLRLPQEFSMTREWFGVGWLHYKPAPQLDLAAGLRAGFVDVRPGNNMSYVRPQVRVEWRASDSLLLQVTGGRERRTFYSHPDIELNQTVYNASVEYRPMRTTTLSFFTARDFEVSYFSGQVTENTRRGLQLQQRLLQHFYLWGGLDRQIVRYIGTPLAFTAFNSRLDEQRGWSVHLVTTFLRRGTISVSYRRSRNISNVEGYSYSSNQYGIELGYRF